MRSLKEIYVNYSFVEGHGDKGTAHTYIDEYERLLTPYRDNINFLEVGVSHGESIQMWSEFFNDSNIFGVDITPVNLRHLLDREEFKIIIGDATQESILELLPKDIMFDVIIDDGSHILYHQINTFNIFKSRMKEGGIFIIEDVNNIDGVAQILSGLHTNCEIIDNRHIKNRYDDVLVVYRF
jgi:23S rRNA U2552 (ribose-2'-O)-methylase RlmE/FtsJ